MSKIVFLLSKNVITAQSDEHIELTDDSSGYADTKASLWIDGEEVYWCTVTDEGGYLEYTIDFSVGDHTIEIRTSEGDSTDLHVDQLFIDDKLCMPSQYNLENVVWGYDSALKFLLADPIKQNKQSKYIWWGEVYNSSNIWNSDFYRPRLVSDLGYNWRWYITVKSNGTVWWNHVPDTDDVLYDSTASYDYYLTSDYESIDHDNMVTLLEDVYFDLLLQIGSDSTEEYDYDSTDPLTMRYAFGGSTNTWHILHNDSSSLTNADGTTNQYGNYVDLGTYKGPGLYDDNLQIVDGNALSERAKGLGPSIVIYNFRDYCKAVVNKWYHASFTITPIQVTTS